MNETRRNIIMPNLTGLSEKYRLCIFENRGSRSQGANQPVGCLLEIVQSCISYPLEVMKQRKNVHFVFICDLIKNNVIRSHLMNVFFPI